VVCAPPTRRGVRVWSSRSPLDVACACGLRAPHSTWRARVVCAPPTRRGVRVWSARSPLDVACVLCEACSPACSPQTLGVALLAQRLSHIRAGGSWAALLRSSSWHPARAAVGSSVPTPPIDAGAHSLAAWSLAGPRTHSHPPLFPSFPALVLCACRSPPPPLRSRCLILVEYDAWVGFASPRRHCRGCRGRRVCLGGAPCWCSWSVWCWWPWAWRPY